MPDWERYIRDNLELPELRDLGEERVIEEMVAHLDTLYRETILNGMSEEEVEVALSK